MTAECDWGGWTAVWSTLLFWHKWLVESLRHADVAPWPSVALKFYTTADPLATAIAVSLVIAALCFLLSLPTNNHSFVDKLWSFTPVYYTLHFALHDKLAHSHVPLNPRLSIMAALVTVWGARLTFNFARKGGYRWSAEDYRWPYIRDKVNSTLAFLVFNLTFIATYQHLLLLSIATPAYLAWQNVGAPLNALDLAAAALCAFFITYETVADQQQWTFQNAKHAKLAAGKRLTGVFAAGFNTSGLFRYSRHPNFWAEQSMWCAFYLFGVAASGRWVNWTIVAPLQLILLFQGSTWLTEKITASKYPKYADYQASTSCFFPWFPDAPAPDAAPLASASEKRSTRRDSKGAAAEAAPATPTAATAQVTDEDEAVPPTTAAKRRTTARKTKAASAEEAAEETLADTPRPQRSARKPARAKAAEESVPTRQSSRLRTKA